jgi:hypothetical protein
MTTSQEREQREEAEAQAKEYNRELEAAKRAGLPEVVSNRMISARPHPRPHSL